MARVLKSQLPGDGPLPPSFGNRRGLQMASLIDRYRANAAICAGTDHASNRSVREHNAAAKRMRAIVAEAYAAGPLVIAELLPLLDEPPSDRWLAFQLLELCQPEASDAERCLSIIRRMAAGSDADAVGAEFWLRDWAAKHSESDAPPDRWIGRIC